MLPEVRNDERGKNGSTSLRNEYDFEEVDEDLVEIVRSYERKKEDDSLEVRVLVIKPGNKQRLLTCDVPLRCDERDILAKVHTLFADRKYYVNMYTVNLPTLGFDYIVEYCENDNGEDLDTIINGCLRENYQIPTREDKGDEVIILTRNEANHTSDDEIEEIRADDEVFIEKIILKHDLLDQEMEENTGTVDVECEEMELDERQIEEDRRSMEEDVIPIEREEDSEIQEVPVPIEKFTSGSEGDKENEDLKIRIENCVNKITLMASFEEDQKEIEAAKPFDQDLEQPESEIDMEDDKPSFEEVTESEKEMEEVKAAYETGKEIDSEKEMEEDEKAVEDDVETVCITDDILGDDENENSSQTSGDKTILFIYPMSRGGITVTRDDYECLNEYQYLNDIIIDFYLNYLLKEVLSQEDRERTHLFSSHFYTRLTKHITDENSDLSPDERRYVGVQRWTKDVDIFQKDFIIVPINEHSHWFLAIICFPKLVDFVGWRDQDCENKGIELQKPCILIFDSLGATKKPRVAITLRGYLRHEYIAKMNETKQFTCNNLKSVYPKIPCQQNATDCGLYLLQYVESFFKNPLLDFTLPLKDLSDWFSRTVIEKKRERIAKLIAKLAIKYNKEKFVKLPILKLPKPKLPETSVKAKSNILTKKSETSAKAKAIKVQLKKKIQTKRNDASKRLKMLCDTDDSDSDTVLPASLTNRSKLHISSKNPQPLRRSAFMPRSQVSNFYSWDDSDDSLPSIKTTSIAPSTVLKSNAGSSCSITQSANFRTYQGPCAKSSWSDFSELTDTKKEKGNQDFSKFFKTTSVLKSNLSADRFYNISASFDSQGISPSTSYLQFKIKKKNLNSEI